ncbi:hypothetical protein [Streptomyces sp. NPDC049887]|uniref:hypothetical protein n=1 Tax=Streptomyces sp. NPDC049887 TaxID=3155654 RepID=UPI003437A645
MIPLDALKGSSTSRASTTTVTADPELSVDVEANAEYVLDAYIRYSGSTAADITIQFTGPSGSSGSYGGYMLDIGETVEAGAKRSIRTPINSARDVGCISTSTAMVMLIKGRLIVGGTAGAFSFDWAQRVSNGTATVVESDSWFSVRRVA